MTIRKLDKPNWRLFFEDVSRLLEGNLAEVEVASLALGDQVEADWLPLLGIVYDPQDDLIEVALDSLDHMIRQPTEISIDELVGGLTSIQVVDADGTKQLINLRDPLTLPAPVH